MPSVKGSKRCLLDIFAVACASALSSVLLHIYLEFVHDGFSSINSKEVDLLTPANMFPLFNSKRFVPNAGLQFVRPHRNLHSFLGTRHVGINAVLFRGLKGFEGRSLPRACQNSGNNEPGYLLVHVLLSRCATCYRPTAFTESYSVSWIVEVAS